jgi:hypothetical protein
MIWQEERAMSDWWNRPTRPRVEPPASTAELLPSCPWCAEPALPDASSCSNCGAAKAQHEDLGGLVIPGVTVVDPAMQARSYTSLLIGSQARMSTLSLIGRAPGGTVLQVAAAAAMLASDGARGSGGTVKPDDIGRPSQAALEMAERLRQPTVPAAPPNRDEFSTAQPDAPEAGTAVTGESL